MTPARIELATNDAEKLLVLEEIERFSDGSGYVAHLHVHSTWLTFTHRFSFHEIPLTDAISNLTKMAKGEPAAAKLTGLWEGDFVQLELNNLGHLYVTGEIGYEGGPDFQHVSFSFRTDQTVILPLLRDLTALLHTKV